MSIRRRAALAAARSIMLGTAALVLLPHAASASIETWTFSGTVATNLLAPDAITVDGVAGTTANLTSAGIMVGSAFSATVTFESTTQEYLNQIRKYTLCAPNFDVGIYPTGNFNWTLGSLSARTARSNQNVSYLLNVQAPDIEPAVYFDVVAIGGGKPAAFNGATYNLSVRTRPAQSGICAGTTDIGGDIGIAPAIAFGLFPGTLANNKLQINPPTGFVPQKGFSIPLRDDSTGQAIVVNGVISAHGGGGTTPSCAGFGGDTDGDTICDDVDLCVAVSDIAQGDADQNGIGNACNDAFDADGDEYEDANDGCPALFSYNNFCVEIPALPPAGYLLLTAMIVGVALGTLVHRSRRA